MAGRVGLFILLACSLFATAGEAQRSHIGHGRLVVNDLLGDGHDRWRTGSVAASYIWGPEWTGHLPEGFGQVLEFRILGEIITPASLTNPAPGDRPYAAQWGLGLHTHFNRGGFDFGVGADLAIIGPQTGLPDLQDSLHDFLGVPRPSNAVLANQIPNQFKINGILEVGRDVNFGSGQFRPFIEARSGTEVLARIGADFTFGQVGQGELLVRDPVTGHRYRTILQRQPGWSFVAGGDIAYVGSSVFLPESRGYQLTDSRQRLRAGFHWTSERQAIFYGLSWHGKEFVGQSSDQVLGSIRLNLRF